MPKKVLQSLDILRIQKIVQREVKSEIKNFGTTKFDLKLLRQDFKNSFEKLPEKEAIKRMDIKIERVIVKQASQDIQMVQISHDIEDLKEKSEKTLHYITAFLKRNEDFFVEQKVQTRRLDNHGRWIRVLGEKTKINFA